QGQRGGGSLRGREVDGAVATGEGGELVAGGRGAGVRVPGGQQQQVRAQRRAVLELDDPADPGPARAPDRLVHGRGGRAVHGDGDGLRQRGEHLAEEPFEVERLDPARGEVRRPERVDLGEARGAGGGGRDLAATDPFGPLGQGRAGDGRARAGHGLVG